MHGVSFSASGNKLAWVGHDSSINVVNAANECKVATIQGDFLPFAACVWVTENSIITAGNDCPFDNGIICKTTCIITGKFSKKTFWCF